MRLLTVGSLPPEWGGPQRGGVATFHAALLEGLAGRTGEVELLGALTPAPPSCEPPVPTFPRPERVSTAAHYEELLDRLRPDAVLMNHIANTIGVTHARLEGAPPAVGIVHSWHNVTFRHGGERQRARDLTEEALSGLAALVCPSWHCLSEGERLGFEYPALTETVHYPLQPLFAASEVEPRSAEREGVLYVGSLVGRKNPAGLVEAAASLPGVPVTLVGEGPEQDRLAMLIENLGLAPRVSVTDLPGPDHLRRLRDLFLRSQMLCLPSRSESFGIVFIEALASGTPVVGFAPTVREIGEAMGMPIGVPLGDDSPAAIAAAIERVAAAEWDREQLRARTLDAFGLQSAVGAYLDLIGRAVDDGLC